MSRAYKIDMSENTFRADTASSFAWGAYFPNVVVAALASAAVSAVSDNLTEANFLQVMTVEGTRGENIVAGVRSPQLLVNGRDYNAATDSVHYIGRWVVGCCPAPEIPGSGYAVTTDKSLIRRTNDGNDPRILGMYSIEGVVTPSALTAHTWRCKGLPQEAVLGELVDGYVGKGIGLAMAALWDTEDKWLGIASVVPSGDGSECVVTFSRPYAHPPVVTLGDGDTSATIVDITERTVTLRLHTEILERRVFASILAIGFIA